MTSDQTISNLNKIVELSGAMLAVAREGDWAQVQEIEQKRKQLFDQIFPLDRDTVTNPTELSRQIRKIADLDKETMALMQESRKDLSGLVNKISLGRQAVDAYRDVQGR